MGDWFRGLDDELCLYSIFLFIYLFLIFKTIYLFYLFIFDCVGSLLLRVGFL